MNGSRRFDRRAFLALGVAGIAGMAGCTGGSGGESDGTSGMDGTDAMGGSDGSGGTGTDAARTLATHPAGREIAAQPSHGPQPGEAAATIVAFEDPSCPRCAAFERDTVPRIRSELVDTGKATFVFRGYPVVYPWGEPASHALEAAFARDPDAHWALAAHYFETQGEFTTDNVLDRTESFLDESTDLDGAAVVAAAEAGEADAAVETDLAAGRDANASATPTVFLFRDGQYRTRAAGSVSYDVVAGALGF